MCLVTPLGWVRVAVQSAINLTENGTAHIWGFDLLKSARVHVIHGQFIKFVCLVCVAVDNLIIR